MIFVFYYYVMESLPSLSANRQTDDLFYGNGGFPLTLRLIMVYVGKTPTTQKAPDTYVFSREFHCARFLIGRLGRMLRLKQNITRIQ